LLQRRKFSRGKSIYGAHAPPAKARARNASQQFCLEPFVAHDQFARNVLYGQLIIPAGIDIGLARWSYVGALGNERTHIRRQSKRDHAIL
jgi:hypothetical protein